MLYVRIFIIIYYTPAPYIVNILRVSYIRICYHIRWASGQLIFNILYNINQLCNCIMCITSPCLYNTICLPIRYRINQLIQRFGPFRFTRYSTLNNQKHMNIKIIIGIMYTVRRKSRKCVTRENEHFAIVYKVYKLGSTHIILYTRSLRKALE